MLGLFWAGAAACAWLGYKLYDWWVPVLVAAAVAAGQFGLFHMAGGRLGPAVQMLAFAVMDLVVFHATFGIGRSLGQRMAKRRKGMR
jgi:hypothetical protein